MMKMDKSLFKKLILPLFILLATLTTAFAQKKVTGKISDADGGLPGATVAVKGTSSGVVTDVDGNFSIDAPSGSTLVISSVGYTTQEIAVGNSTVIDVTMEQDTKTLSELVVTGYGTQSKRDITGAVASLEAKKLLNVPASNLGQAMQGKIAGVTVGNDNSPGGGVMVRVRGFGTINDNSPLYIVDGTPTKGSLTSINPNDIESVQVLKDASAASIYGSRAGNGVVIITTKKGKLGKSKFTYDAYYVHNKRVRNSICLILKSIWICTGGVERFYQMKRHWWMVNCQPILFIQTCLSLVVLLLLLVIQILLRP